MSWIGISDGRRAIRTPTLPTAGTIGLLSTGSIVVELQFNASKEQRQTVLELDRSNEWQRLYRVVLTEDCRLLLEHRQGAMITHALLQFPATDRDANLRLTLSWSATDRIGLIAVENLDTGQISQSIYREPHPWPMDDIEALLRLRTGCRIDPTTTLLGFADHVAPVGLNTGFAAGTLVDTARGARPVETLRPGDEVQTSEHGMQPIRRIARYEVPAYGRFAPVQLRAPFFGLTKDITVAPDHRLLIEGVDAEYLFGSDTVLVEARHLATMAASRHPEKRKTIRYVQVLLDAHVCLSVAGAWAESLYIGDLAEHPTRHATSPLAGVPEHSLPRHTSIASPQLRSYEAMVLVSALCA